MARMKDAPQKAAADLDEIFDIEGEAATNGDDLRPGSRLVRALARVAAVAVPSTPILPGRPTSGGTNFRRRCVVADRGAPVYSDGRRRPKRVRDVVDDGGIAAQRILEAVVRNGRALGIRVDDETGELVADVFEHVATVDVVPTPDPSVDCRSSDDHMPLF